MSAARHADPDPERSRLTGPDAAAWRTWGPYLSDRAWGTVREDYSAEGDAWEFFPHDHARSRTYRWNEDGFAGLCDDQQRLCFSLALWNGADPILKERAFGLTGPQGNHGEDVKDYWWFVDSTPTHSWMRWRYAYPQARFPYEDLIATNAARSRTDPEYELLDTGVFDDEKYFDVVVDYAKAAPDDICITIRATNRGPDAAPLHLLPTLWFRDTWTWQPGAEPPSMRLDASGAIAATHPDLGTMVLAGNGSADALFCENATNTQRLFGEPGPAFPKDGINDYVVSGAGTVNPQRVGTKAALHYSFVVEPGATEEIRLRLAPASPAKPDLAAGWDAVLAERSREADRFYAAVGEGATADEAPILRQAFAGMLWSKQYYSYSVARWLAGDPGEPTPPPERLKGRNSRWQTFDAHGVVSMPDPWEYPWFAAWDLAFHCVTLAHIDPEFAKQQLSMVIGHGWMHPTGMVPAYEWDFGAVNPPVHAWAALRIFHTDGGRDIAWLRQVFERLNVNTTWWISKNDPDGDGAFTGGFLGMDNIGPFDRGEELPPDATLKQADATGWMALNCLSMLEMAAILSEHEPALEDMALRYFELFSLIARASDSSGIWHADEGFFYDQLERGDEVWPIGVRSMDGLVPLFAVVTLRAATIARMPDLRARLSQFRLEHPNAAAAADLSLPRDDAGDAILALVDRNRLVRVLRIALDPAEMLSDHGVRSVSAVYRGHPYVFHGGLDDSTTIDYEPAESTTPLFGGNSNWRGPVWMPVNFMLLQALRRYGEALGDEVTVEHPVGSGSELTLAQVADDLASRLAGLYLPDASGARAVWGGEQKFTTDPLWRDSLLFFEYFHGDNGAGLGASHQTGWTGLVANVLLERIQARAAS
jgi:hypothetical protein